MTTYWLCFSDGLTIKGSVRYAKAYAAANNVTFSVLAPARMSYV